MANASQLLKSDFMCINTGHKFTRLGLHIIKSNVVVTRYHELDLGLLVTSNVCARIL